MKSIQMTALLLWGIIFIVLAFIVGQILASKEIFDVTGIVTGEGNKEEVKENPLGDDLESINKIGQETVRIGLNIAKDYFSDYYSEYVNYIMSNSDSYPVNVKVNINDTLASEYAFYAISNEIDEEKYLSYDNDDEVIVLESSINSFIDTMFEKEIDDAFKKDGKYGYDKISRKYTVDKNNTSNIYLQELDNIENVTANQMILTYTCRSVNTKDGEKKAVNDVELTVVYKGGRYIVTEVEKKD